MAVALAPRRWPRVIALTAAIAGLVFVLNALASPPEIPAVTASVRLGLPPSPLIVTGAGEVVAAAALTVSIAGLLVSLAPVSGNSDSTEPHIT